MKKRIPLAKPSFGREELVAIQRVLESGMLAEAEVTEKFERAFESYLGVRNAVATSSCTTALYLALLALGVKNGDEVIVPDFTFPATGNVVFHTGAKPVLVDIDIRTFNIDPDSVNEAINNKTKVIIPVHLFGQSAEMNRVMEIAKDHDIRVVEDAACSIGATHFGKNVGTFGDVSCFSFHPRKILTTGEGGMLVTDDDELAEKTRILKNHGAKKTVENKPRFIVPGYNFRLNDIASALGLVQLEKVTSFVEERVRLAREYNRILSDEEAVNTPWVASGNNHVYQTYCILMRKQKIRDRLIDELGKKGIETQIGTYALHLQPTYQQVSRARDLSSSENAFSNTLALPMYNGLSEEDQEDVCSSMTDLL